MAKSCPKGQYYCYTDKKCKKIPKGYMIGARGYLRQEPQEDDSKQNGNGNGNGHSKSNGSGRNGGGNGNGGNGGNGGGGGMSEATMTSSQKRKDTMLKKKYDDSDMKQNMIDQYGKEEGMKVYYATIRKQAMKKKKKKKIKEDVSGLEVQNVSDGIKFREYEFIDVVKPEPMRSPKNNITWTEGCLLYTSPSPRD